MGRGVWRALAFPLLLLKRLGLVGLVLFVKVRVGWAAAVAAAAAAAARVPVSFDRAKLFRPVPLLLPLEDDGGVVESRWAILQPQ